MLTIKKPVTLQSVRKNHNHFFKTMVKIVVDVEKEKIAKIVKRLLI